MLTPQKASERAGVSRTTIMKAVKSLDLKALRDNQNRWKIDPQDLDLWAETKLTRNIDATLKPSETATPDETPGLRTEVAILKAQLAGKEDLIAQLRSDLDHARKPLWKKLAGR